MSRLLESGAAVLAPEKLIREKNSSLNRVARRVDADAQLLR
jgi:hypothetical protein